MDFEWSEEQLQFRESVLGFGGQLNEGLRERETNVLRHLSLALEAMMVAWLLVGLLYATLYVSWLYTLLTANLVLHAATRRMVRAQQQWPARPGGRVGAVASWVPVEPHATPAERPQARQS